MESLDEARPMSGQGARRDCLTNAADLLRGEPPGPTPFLVHDLLVEGAIAAILGPPKIGKTWLVLDFALAVVRASRRLVAIRSPAPAL